MTDFTRNARSHPGSTHGHTHNNRTELRRARGFTLVELVVTLVVSSIVAGFIAALLATPVQAYFSQTSRAALVDSAEAIVRNLDADVRTALPNSLRLGVNGNIVVLELLATADAQRYWEVNESNNSAQVLDFTTADTQFSTLGAFNAAVHGLPAKSFYLVVNNTRNAGYTAYQLANVVAPKTSVTLGATANGEDPITLAPGFKFVQASPTHTVFVMTQPVAYLCDQTARTLTRYSGYSIAPNITQRNTAAKLNAAGATSALVAMYPAACQFDFQDGTNYHGGLLSVRVQLVNGNDSLPLFHQIPVERIP
ncbi:MAG TPA: prepilin-type N-terminal cleavage/methylation domain-containing protein [Steroidobacteraceae bacterium]|nr:prepilin-type N-terminal cleavage/methylation domain-containing protein [Steroidobacteraceae bacterium]